VAFRIFRKPLDTNDRQPQPVLANHKGSSPIDGAVVRRVGDFDRATALKRNPIVVARSVEDWSRPGVCYALSMATVLRLFENPKSALVVSGCAGLWRVQLHLASRFIQRGLVARLNSRAIQSKKEGSGVTATHPTFVEGGAASRLRSCRSPSRERPSTL
jgi:hypothetical protein